MRATVFHGHGPEDSLGVEVHGRLLESLHRRGWEADDLDLAGMRLAPCTGCFDCWLKTPGLCTQKDDGRKTAGARALSDAFIVLSRVTFGGYSSRVKTAMDRNLPTLLPLFTKYRGEMHHPQRYRRQAFLALGWQDRPEGESAGIFARLAGRNALNMQATASGSLVLHGGQSAGERQEAVETLLEKLEARP